LEWRLWFFTYWHPLYWKYKTYCTVVRKGPSNGRNTYINVVNFGHAVFEIYEQTDRQTERHKDRNISHPSDGTSIINDKTLSADITDIEVVYDRSVDSSGTDEQLGSNTENGSDVILTRKVLHDTRT